MLTGSKKGVRKCKESSPNGFEGVRHDARKHPTPQQPNVQRISRTRRFKRHTPRANRSELLSHRRRNRLRLPFHLFIPTPNQSRKNQQRLPKTLPTRRTRWMVG
ncbi:MAG: hypothetical protein AAF630_12390 [Cyanobacteria bacterium P01_C01_bin.38]